MAPRQQLRNTVDRLRDELADGEPLDAHERADLERALAEVAGLLDDDSALEGRDHGSLSESLRQAALRFEDSHPKLTLAIGAVADSLSRLGI